MGLLNHKWGSENIDTEQASGEVVSSAASLILVGPARLDSKSLKLATEKGSNLTVDNTKIIPLSYLGATAMVDFRSTKPNQLFQEIGSRRVYPISDKPKGISGSIRSIMVYNKSLLKALYEGKYNLSNDTTAYHKSKGSDSEKGLDWKAFLAGDKPGSENARGWYGLQSRIYTSYIGLGFWGISNKDREHGAMWIDDVLLESHLVNLSADQNLMMEVVSFQGGFSHPLDIGVEK